jgi:hypothetical protein
MIALHSICIKHNSNREYGDSHSKSIIGVMAHLIHVVSKDGLEVQISMGILSIEVK